MEIKDLSWWKILPLENLKEGCELKCPECGAWAVHTEWKESYVYCELCVDHEAIKCPNCDEAFDHVWSKTFECRVSV